VKKKPKPTEKTHVVVFGFIFLFVLSFIIVKLAEGVSLWPGEIVVHTNILYYDGHFSDTNKTEDTKTALYVLNQSNENIYATIFEFDKNHKEVRVAVQIGPWQNQYIKTEGPGVVYLSNADGTAKSVVKFSRWYTAKKYTIPDGFVF
jgi:hypothetical protein